MKKKTSQKPKSRSVLDVKAKKTVSVISALHHRIQSDLFKLRSAYEKSIVSLDKSIARALSVWDKSKKKINQAALGKKKAVDKTTQSVRMSLEKELAVLKAKKARLANEYKKFLAQQKTIQLFEKEWAQKTNHTLTTKKATKAHKKPSKIKKASAVKPASTEDVVLF